MQCHSDGEHRWSLEQQSGNRRDAVQDSVAVVNMACDERMHESECSTWYHEQLTVAVGRSRYKLERQSSVDIVKICDSVAGWHISDHAAERWWLVDVVELHRASCRRWVGGHPPADTAPSRTRIEMCVIGVGMDTDATIARVTWAVYRTN